MTMTWLKSSSNAIRAAEGPYWVSRATVLDTDSGELVDAFTAWFGRERLADFRGSDGPTLGRAACERHAEDLKGRPSDATSNTHRACVPS